MNTLNRKLMIIFLFLIGTVFAIVTFLIANGQGDNTQISTLLFYTSLGTIIAGLSIPVLSFKYFKIEKHNIKYWSFLIGATSAFLVLIDNIFAFDFVYNDLKKFSDNGGLWSLNILLLIFSLLLTDLDDQLKVKNKFLENEEEITKMRVYIKLLEEEMENKNNNG